MTPRSRTPPARCSRRRQRRPREQPGIYAARLVSTLVGIAGYRLLRNGQRAAGFILSLGYIGYGWRPPLRQFSSSRC
jgi:hypothetical protein